MSSGIGLRSGQSATSAIVDIPCLFCIMIKLCGSNNTFPVSGTI